jgi:hypothetical protein
VPGGLAHPAEAAIEIIQRPPSATKTVRGDARGPDHGNCRLVGVSMAGAEAIAFLGLGVLVMRNKVNAAEKQEAEEDWVGETGGEAGGRRRDFLATLHRDIPLSPTLRPRELVGLISGRDPGGLWAMDLIKVEKVITDSAVAGGWR